MMNVSLEEFKNEWLLEITEGNPTTTELGNRFAQKIISQWLELDNYSDDIIFCDGCGDGGIDVAYLHRGEVDESGEADGDTWFIVQSKYGSSFQGTNTLLTEAKKFFDTMEGVRPRLSSLSSNVTERLKTFVDNSSDKDKLILVYATTDSMTIEDKRTLVDVKILGRSKIGQMFDVEAVSIETIYKRLTEKEEKEEEEKLTIKLVGQLVSSGDELLVGSIKLEDLYNFLKLYKSATGDLDLIYQKNVRKFLGNKRKVNKGIEKTLLERPERFGLYNNGITIVVNDFESDNNGIFYLTEPYIVNGCQTTKSIWGVLVKKLESGGTGYSLELEEYKRKLEKGIVVVKVVKVGSRGEDLLIETTRYTNSQNSVTEKDFLALEKDFQNWSKQMAFKYNIYLEIQRGGWESRKALQKQNPSITPFKEHVNCFDLIKVYSAGWLGEAGLAFGKNPPFSPGGVIFNKIVNDASFNLDDLYAAYLLSKEAEQFKFGKGAEKKSRGQTRYLYFMVFMQLLNHIILKADTENYDNKDYFTKCIISLNKDENINSFRELQSIAVSIIDEYMTMEGEYSYTKEPKFISRGDINSFLKWEQLGKDGTTPILNELISGIKSFITRQHAYESLAKCIKDAKNI